MFLPSNILRYEFDDRMNIFPRYLLGMNVELSVLSMKLARMICLLGSRCLTDVIQKQLIMLLSFKGHDGSNLIWGRLYFSRQLTMS
jgi:hypothetical protein